MSQTKNQIIDIYLFINLKNLGYGSDRLCKVVELSMQCCGKLLSDLFETY